MAFSLRAGVESGDDGLPDAGRAITIVDAADLDLGRRLDQTIVIPAGPRSDPLRWPAQLASHGWAARDVGRFRTG
jgi:hypothetical protein